VGTLLPELWPPYHPSVPPFGSWEEIVGVDAVGATLGGLRGRVEGGVELGFIVALFSLER